MVQFIQLLSCYFVTGLHAPNTVRVYHATDHQTKCTFIFITPHHAHTRTATNYFKHNRGRSHVKKNRHYVPSLTTMAFYLLCIKLLLYLLRLSVVLIQCVHPPILTQTENEHHQTQQIATYSQLQLTFPHPFTLYSVCN